MTSIDVRKQSAAGSDSSSSSGADVRIAVSLDTTLASAPSAFHGARGMSLTLKDVRFALPSNKNKGQEAVLLQGVSGVFEAGRMTALMGPSGSGKTTLLDILAGRKTIGATTGEIRFSGATPTPAFLRRYTGYVEQFDTLIPTLTVFEMLMYTAELKRPRSEPYESKRAAVEALTTKLGLEGCRDVKIGSQLAKGISGGQAKRTNIGIALITNPRVLFLDEPTSGLDSTTANEVMTVVKRLADEGVTVVATIHSPTAFAFSLFDQVMVLTRGHMTYYGDTEAGLDAFFADALPADLLERMLATVGAGCGGGKADLARLPNKAEALIDAITEADKQGRAPELAERFAGSVSGQAAHKAVLKRVASKHELTEQQQKELSTTVATVTPMWWGIRTILRYRTLNNYRDPEYVMPRIADKFFVGILVLALYWQLGTYASFSGINNQTAMLFMWVTLPAFGATSYMPSIVLERALFVRERNDGLYRVITYLVAKMIDEIMLATVTTLLVSTFVWFAVGLTGSFAVFWAVYFVTLCNGIIVAYLVASFAPSMDAANAILPTYVITLLYFGGLLITFNDMPVYLHWYSYIDFVKYGWGALMVNQFQATDPAWVGGQSVLQFFGFDGVNPWAFIGYESLFFVVYFAMAWTILSVRKFSSR